jgi:hypothetical protein
MAQVRQHPILKRLFGVNQINGDFDWLFIGCWRGTVWSSGKL